MSDKIEKGREGENLAAEFLKDKGWQIVSRNFRYKKAEIDLIITRDDWTVFVEVKTRSSAAYGEPEEFVDEFKARKIFEAAEEYIFSTNWLGHVRFDVVSIKLDSPPEIVHFEDAINQFEVHGSRFEVSGKHNFIALNEATKNNFKLRTSNQFIRSSAAYGEPEEFVDEFKARKIFEAAEEYIFSTNWLGHVRFDVVSIKLGSPPEILHFEDAINQFEVHGSKFEVSGKHNSSCLAKLRSTTSNFKLRTSNQFI